MKKLDGFDEFVEQLIDQWHVPGLAVGIVQNDEIVLAKGYGYCDLRAKKPVTSQTLFALASVTKSFTTTGLAMIVDKGELSWDVPICEYMPEFKLIDKLATRKSTLRDLLTHRTGLPRHDSLWEHSGLARNEIIERLQHLDFSTEFRQKWQYNNLMYLVAGYLIEKLTNSSWETFTRNNILTPLGMRRTKFEDEISGLRNLAKPYHYHDGKLKLNRFQMDRMHACSPAGGIYSNVKDMLAYLNFHINRGEHQGQQLLSQNCSQEIQSQQVVIPGESNFEEIGPACTCLGFETSTYRGYRYIFHGGATIGYISRMSFIPSKKTGFILLSNLHGFEGENPVPWIIARNLKDRILDLEQVDWNSRISNERKRYVAMNDDAYKNAGKYNRKGTKPSHPLNEYLGDFMHPAYGLIRIKQAGKNSGLPFNLEFNGYKSSLNHVHFDTFATPQVPYALDSLGWRKMEFHTNKHGDIDRISTTIEREVDDAIFKRVAVASLCTRKVLNKYKGRYKFKGGIARAWLNDSGILLWTTPFKETFELIPYIENKFKIKGLANNQIEFKSNKHGKINRAYYLGNSLAAEAKKIVS